MNIPEFLKPMYDHYVSFPPGSEPAINAAEVVWLIERLSLAEERLAEQDWRPITDDYLPKKADLVGGYDPEEAIPLWRMRIVGPVIEMIDNCDYLRHLGYTHFCRKSPPQITAPGGEKE